ncbi:MAG: 3-dehydroquinate synthase [Chitinophagaceae bacterium]|nr:3-dehydroquinate synthase [Chitinophagaceae bacterium]
MTKKTIRFNSGATDFYFAGGFSQLQTITDRAHTVLITDENVFEAHSNRFKGWKLIVLPAGEEHKTQPTVDTVINLLIEMEADRKTTLVGIGGGVVTDITGYVASIYMRGLRFGFIPTSLLALVDASIGGKNGIDVGVYKNMVGVIRQPHFILHDMGFLKSLPQKEWQNGFAEIVKHACIRDNAMFMQLESASLKQFQSKKTLITALVQRNALLKAKVVQRDETEQGERRLLNFGHTLGHALENQYTLMHGEAVSIGIGIACKLSEKLAGFKQTDRVLATLEKYGLPVHMDFDRENAINILRMDKKAGANTTSLYFVRKK